MKRALYGAILSVGISMKRSVVLLIGLFVLIGFISRTEAADSILVGAINPPPPGTSYGYAVNGDTWVAIQFGLTKPVQVNSVGVVLNSALDAPSVVVQGLIVDSLNFNHITYSTFSIANPQSATEMTIVALPSPL